MPVFQISGTGIGVARGYASSQMMVPLTEARMHFGSVFLVLWLVIGGVAAAQRGDYTDHLDCSSASTLGVTILAGPLNYTGVDPHVNCSTPRPSN
jgi:hypothetical protein